MLSPAGDDARIRDLASERGTFVNGRLIVGEHLLGRGDLIEMGNSAFEIVEQTERVPLWPNGPSSGLSHPDCTRPAVLLDSLARALLLGTQNSPPWLPFERLLERLSMPGKVRRIFLATFSCSSGALSDIALGHLLSEQSPPTNAIRVLVGDPGPDAESFARSLASRRGWTSAAAIRRAVRTLDPERSIVLLHAKLLVLHLDTGHHLAIVGSSNASFAGYVENCDLNVAFTWRFGDPFGLGATADVLWRQSAPLPLEASAGDTLRTTRIRPYRWQASRIHALRSLWRSASTEEPRRASELSGYTVELPPGTGKTLIAVELLRPILESGRRVLWLSHRQALLAQAATTMSRQLGASARLGTFQGAAIQQPDAPCVLLATDAKLSRHLATAARLPFEVIVIDEVHRYGASRYLAIARALRARMLLGLSATPARRGRGREQRAFEARFQRTGVVQRMPLAVALRLRERGRPILAHVRHVSVDTGWVMRVPIDDPWSLEFQERRQIGSFAKFFNPLVLEVFGALLTRFAAEIGRLGPTLFFAADVAHAVRLERGVQALLDALGRHTWIRQYHSKVPVRSRTRSTELELRRDEFLARASAGEDPVLIGVDIVSEGFDLPPVQTLILCRPTLSLRLYTQMIGRGLRGPAMGGGEYCNLVHFGAQTRIAGRRGRPFVDIRDVLTDSSPRVETLGRLQSLLSTDKAIARTRADSLIALEKGRSRRARRR